MSRFNGYKSEFRRTKQYSQFDAVIRAGLPREISGLRSSFWVIFLGHLFGLLTPPPQNGFFVHFVLFDQAIFTNINVTCLQLQRYKALKILMGPFCSCPLVNVQAAPPPPPLLSGQLDMSTAT